MLLGVTRVEVNDDGGRWTVEVGFVGGKSATFAYDNPEEAREMADAAGAAGHSYAERARFMRLVADHDEVRDADGDELAADTVTTPTMRALLDRASLRRSRLLEFDPANVAVADQGEAAWRDALRHFGVELDEATARVALAVLDVLSGQLNQTSEQSAGAVLRDTATILAAVAA